MRNRLFFGLSLGLCSLVSAEDFSREDAENPVCQIRTSMGDIYVEMFVKEAPKTVRNFIDLAEGRKEFTDPKTGKKVTRHFYDDLVFHRVIKGFMIQGGCPLGNGRGGPGYKFEDEINAEDLGLDDKKVMTQRGRLTLKEALENMGYRYNRKLKSHHPKKGVLAMANSGPNTNGSQFFINLVDTPHLAGKHTVFGKVVKGMGVVEAIGDVAVGAGSRPVKDVRVISIREVK